MAIFKVYQDKRQTINGQANPYYGKFYGKAIHMPKVVDTLELARRVQKNVSVKISDVVAVLREASDVMNVALLSSERVQLDGIGSFKAAISTSPADSEYDFSASKNIKMSRIIFIPELDPERTDSMSHKDKTLLRGIRWTNAKDLNVNPSEAPMKAPTPGVSPTSGATPLTVTLTDIEAGAQVQIRKGSGSWSDITLNNNTYVINQAGIFYFRQVVNGIASDPSVSVDTNVMP